jgi:hypothetical protein
MPKIVADGLTFVTNNARDFRKLFTRETLHAGLIIIVPQVTPSLQRELFSLVLSVRRQNIRDIRHLFLA